MKSYQQRLNYVIPGGAHTYSRGFDQFPSNAPQILESGHGAYVVDPEKKRYLDYGMALRAVTLGYANQRVINAAIKQVELGNNLTRASMTELRAAELFTELIPSADMVKFAKNGSNVTTAAIKLARAFTGRSYVCAPRQHPFFSFDDWFIGTTPLQKGVPNEHSKYSLSFNYNDIDSLQKLFESYPNQISAVILEPATTETPCPKDCLQLNVESSCRSCPNKKRNFLHQVRALCDEHGALMILDEMITGFRWSLKGASYYFDVVPDLITFGKGMANGFSLAAVAGRREVMEIGSIDKPGAERTFLLSSTHGGEMCSLGAFIETVKVYQEEDVCGHMWTYGEQLKSGMNHLACQIGVADYFNVIGPAISLNYLTYDTNGVLSTAFRTLFMQELINAGVLMPWIAVSLMHTSCELELTLSAVEKSLRIYKRALESGVENYLVGPAVQPVFRKYN